MQDNNSEKILNIKELAEYLKCGVSTIRKLIYNNEIPYFKICSVYHFDLDVINKWILNRHNDIDIGGFEYGYRENN